MFTLNGKKFSNQKSEASCVGFYKALKRSIKLFSNATGEHIATINAEGVLCNAMHKLENGKIWYSHATVPEIGEWESYLQSHDDKHAALKICGIQRIYR